MPLLPRSLFETAGSIPVTSVVSTLKGICSSSVERSTSSDVEEKTSLVSYALA